MLGCTVQTIKQLVYDGELKAHCPNGIKKKPMSITTKSINDYYKRHLKNKDDFSV